MYVFDSPATTTLLPSMPAVSATDSLSLLKKKTKLLREKSCSPPPAGHGCKLPRHCKQQNLAYPQHLGRGGYYPPTPGHGGPEIFLTCVSIWIGCQAKGNTYSPVSRRIGFGAWHSTCSGEGSCRRPEMKSQNGFPVITPWVKSNSPGPSVVPAAKLYPRAGGQVCEVEPFARVTGACICGIPCAFQLCWPTLDMSIHWWMN